MGRVHPSDIAWSSDALGRSDESPPVVVRWLGTAGFSIEYGGCTILIDPYVTRASLVRCLAGSLRSDGEAIVRYAPRADAIVAGHTHFDHVLDVPDIARLTGARVFGSRSAAALCRAAGLPEAQVDVVEREPGAEAVVREVGPFVLRFVSSAHSRLLLGRVPFPGDIADCDQVPLRVERYKCGAVFGVEVCVAGRTVYHMGSAELVDANVHTKHIDLLLACAAGWTASRDLPERIAHRLDPGAILLSHWDDFFRPMGKPARLLPAIQFARLVERLTQAARGVRIGTLPILGEVRA